MRAKPVFELEATRKDEPFRYGRFLVFEVWPNPGGRWSVRYGRGVKGTIFERGEGDYIVVDRHGQLVAERLPTLEAAIKAFERK